MGRWVMGSRKFWAALAACLVFAALSAEAASATVGKPPGEGVTCPGHGIWGSEPPGLVPSYTFLGTEELEYGPCDTSAPREGQVAFSKDGLTMRVSAMPGSRSSEAVGFWGATSSVSEVHEICFSENVERARGQIEQSWRIFVNGSLSSGQTRGLSSGALTECVEVPEGDIRWATFITAESGRHTADASSSVTLTGVTYF
jgi:hypothetical protein